MNREDISSIDLRSLFETSRLFNSTTDPNFICNHLLRTLMGKLLASKGAVFLSGFSSFSGEFRHLETVVVETPASLATSTIVGFVKRLSWMQNSIASDREQIGPLVEPLSLRCC